jgi:bisphosphoglycerate-independent phosphoglycerate mutase (AlkP superfamily)
MDTAVRLMETFDGVLGGLTELWDNGLILVTSDHGNMEDLSTRKHTAADVPALVIGEKTAREEFTRDLKDLTDIAPAIWRTVMRS